MERLAEHFKARNWLVITLLSAIIAQAVIL